MNNVKQPHVIYHKDGSIWARGEMKGDVCVGYWEWFRKDGSRMRSGSFTQEGKQVSCVGVFLLLHSIFPWKMGDYLFNGATD
jgi:hypothetical protein